MIRALTLCLTFIVLLTTADNAVQAASLEDLRASGAIGERYDGFAVVRQNTGGAANIVSDVNAKRRDIYKQRAAQQGISAAQVGAVYARQIYNNAPAGTWFLQRDGSWRRK